MARPTELKIFIYLRKSRKDIEEEKKSNASGDVYDTLQRHRQTLLAVAKKERHQILEIFEEVVSGESISERPRIQEMIRSVDSSVVDAVLVMDLDRLGRGDMLDQGLLDRAFRYSGTRILTPNEVYDPASDTWELVFGIKSLVAREELKAITRRMQRGRVSSAAEGKSITKVPPYGYARDENLRLYPDVETAWVVKKIFEMMRDGHGRQAIANELDRLGVKPPNSKRDSWSPSSITAIVKNEVYIGNIIWGQIRYTKRDGKYQQKRMPRDKWTIKEGAHEPIVSKELFDAANRAHTGRFRPSTVTSKRLSNPLAGVLKCEICGFTMMYQPRKDRPNDFIRCTQKSCRDKQRGSSINIVEQRVLDGLKELLYQYEFTAHNGKEHDNVDTSYKKSLIEKKVEEVEELKSQKNKLHDLLERGVYDIDTFMERQQNISGRIDTIESEIYNLKLEIQKDEIRNSTLTDFIPQLKTVIDAYNDAPVEKKNTLLKSVLIKATYLRKKEWKERDNFVIQFYPKI